VLATATSSLSIAELADASGHMENFVGFHLINPVAKIKLVELAFPEANLQTHRRAHQLCKTLGKTPIEVSDVPGLVVNRLLFPYLFRAVELMSETGTEPEDVDSCVMLAPVCRWAPSRCSTVSASTCTCPER